MTARDLIYRSLRILGVLASGETPAASDAQDALTAMNAMVKGWSNNGFMIHENQVHALTLVSGQQSYTIGSTGDFNVARPVSINSAKYESNDIEYDIEVVTEKEWADIPDKDLSSSIPLKVFYNPSYPLGTLKFWPKPSGTPSVNLYVPKPVSSFTNLTTEITLPDGYEEALVYGTAKRLASEYNKALSASDEEILKDALADIMRKNTEPVYQTPDLTGAGDFNGNYDIMLGGYR